MRRTMATVLLALSSVLVIFALDLPPAPDGFSWREAAEIKGALLVPSGWKFSTEKAKGTLVYYVTEQPIKPSEKFLTGVTMNVFLGNRSAPAQIRDTIVAEAKQYSVQVGVGEFGPFKTLQIQFELPATPEHVALTIVRLAVVNPKTDATYYVWFETPTSEWDRTSSKGTAILKTLALNAKV